MTALADSISALLTRLWPERRHQERLLDLGERKGWADADRDAAVQRLAGWLASKLLLPAFLPSSESQASAPPPLPDVPTQGVEPVPGVALRTVAMARLVGTSPKTLANSLSGGLRPDRRDHRWLLLLSRLERGAVDPAGLAFHSRSPASVTEALAGAVVRPSPDAADAMLLMSLVALWQRRRPPSEAKATRGSPLPRRLVAKPAVAMRWDVIALAQVRALVGLALWRGGSFGRVLLSLVLESALTEAHFAPHRARRTEDADDEWGNSWLRVVDELACAPRVVELLGETEAAVYRWRVGRMRAYASGALAASVEVPAHPYVTLATTIDAVRGGATVEHRFAPREAGYLMLLPQARRLGLIEDA